MNIKCSLQGLNQINIIIIIVFFFYFFLPKKVQTFIFQWNKSSFFKNPYQHNHGVFFELHGKLYWLALAREIEIEIDFWVGDKLGNVNSSSGDMEVC